MGIGATRLYENYLSKQQLPSTACWAIMPKLLDHCGFRLDPRIDKLLFWLSARIVFRNIELSDLRLFFDVHTEKELDSFVVRHYLNGDDLDLETAGRIQKYFDAYPHATPNDSHDVESFFVRTQNVEMKPANFPRVTLLDVSDSNPLDKDSEHVKEEQPKLISTNVQSGHINSPFGSFDACWVMYAKKLTQKQKKEILDLAEGELGKKIGATARTVKRLSAALEGAVEFGGITLLIIHYFIEKFFEYRSVGRYPIEDTQIINGLCTGSIDFCDIYTRAHVDLKDISKHVFIESVCSGNVLGKYRTQLQKLKDAAQQLLKNIPEEAETSEQQQNSEVRVETGQPVVEEGASEVVVEESGEEAQDQPAQEALVVEESSAEGDQPEDRDSGGVPEKKEAFGITIQPIDAKMSLRDGQMKVKFTLSGEFTCKAEDMYVILSKIEEHIRSL